MKKLLVLSLICLVPCLSFGGWKVTRPVPTGQAVNPIPKNLGMFAPHGYIPREYYGQATRALNRKLFKPVVNPEVSKLVKTVYPKINPVLPANFSADAVFIAQLENHPCILESQLPYLYSMDIDANLFEDVAKKGKTITVRLKRNLDVFDPISQKFYTLKKSTSLDMDYTQVLAIGQELRGTDLYSVASQNDSFQETASFSSGKRAFLFEDELFSLALLHDYNIFGELFIAAGQQDAEYAVFVELKKSLVVFRKETQDFTTFFKGSHLSLDPQNNSISGEYGVPPALTRENLLKLAGNDTQRVFFEEPLILFSLEDGEIYHAYRANFGILAEGLNPWQPRLISAGDYVVFDEMNESFTIETEEEIQQNYK